MAPLPPAEVPLLDAVGCVLAADVVATAPLPAFDSSAMDGYAVRLSDTQDATATTPVVLAVVGLKLARAVYARRLGK